MGPIAAANIEVDMIIQNVAPDGATTDFTFTVHRSDYAAAQDLLRGTADELGAREVTGDDRIAKISLVGVGMRSHAGIAIRMFEALAAESINIQMISTSEIKISMVIAERFSELAVRCLHEAASLSNPWAMLDLGKWESDGLVGLQWFELGHMPSLVTDPPRGAAA